MTFTLIDMKREIKFRVYCQSVCVMYTPEKAKEFGCNLYNVPMMRDGVLVGDADDIYMQFTGLKDKNGKEIYEGDIVTLYDPYTKSQHITEVIWDDVNCRFAMKYTFVDFDFLITDEIEVIGNIYENSELI